MDGMKEYWESVRPMTNRIFSNKKSNRLNTQASTSRNKSQQSIRIETRIMKHQKGKRATKSKRKIHNPLFLDFIDYINDDFWKKVLVSASENRFPPGFFMKNERICYRVKKTGPSKTKELIFPPDNFQAAKVCIKFFKMYGGLRSVLDMEEEKMIEDMMIAKYRDESSQKISVKARMTMTYYFIEMKTLEYNFNNEQKDKFQTLIGQAFFTQTLNKNSLVIEDGIIIEIKGLYIIDNDNFYINVEECPKRPKNTIKDLETENDYIHPNCSIDRTTFDLNFDKKWENYNKKLSECGNSRNNVFDMNMLNDLTDRAVKSVMEGYSSQQSSVTDFFNEQNSATKNTNDININDLYSNI